MFFQFAWMQTYCKKISGLQHRPFYEQGILQHQLAGSLLAINLTQRFVELPPTLAAPIKQCLPAGGCFRRPAIQGGQVRWRIAKIDEIAISSQLIEKLQSLAATVAVFYSIKPDHAPLTHRLNLLDRYFAALNNSLMLTFSRVLASTRLTITAQAS